MAWTQPVKPGQQGGNLGDSILGACMACSDHTHLLREERGACEEGGCEPGYTLN